MNAKIIASEPSIEPHGHPIGKRVHIIDIGPMPGAITTADHGWFIPEELEPLDDFACGVWNEAMAKRHGDGR